MLLVGLSRHLLPRPWRVRVLGNKDSQSDQLLHDDGLWPLLIELAEPLYDTR